MSLFHTDTTVSRRPTQDIYAKIELLLSLAPLSVISPDEKGTERCVRPLTTLVRDSLVPCDIDGGCEMRRE